MAKLQSPDGKNVMQIGMSLNWWQKLVWPLMCLIAFGSKGLPVNSPDQRKRGLVVVIPKPLEMPKVPEMEPFKPGAEPIIG